MAQENKLESEYKKLQSLVADDFSQRLGYLTDFFESIYKPLKFKFSVDNESDERYIIIKSSLVGTKNYSLGFMVRIERSGVGQMRYVNDIVVRHVEEIKKAFEKAVMQQGIKFIDQTVASSETPG